MSTTQTDIDWQEWCAKAAGEAGMLGAIVKPMCTQSVSGQYLVGKGSEAGDGGQINPQLKYRADIGVQLVQALVVPAALTAIMSVVYNSIEAVRSRPVLQALLEGNIAGWSVYNRFTNLQSIIGDQSAVENIQADPTKTTQATLTSYLPAAAAAKIKQVITRTAVATGVAVAAASYGMHFTSATGTEVPPIRERVAHGLAIAYVTTISSIGSLYVFGRM